MERGRILVVDDDPTALGALCRTVESEGFDVASSGDPSAALEELRARPASLIIADYKMPGMSGVDFLVEARRIAPDAPRLLVTAFCDFDVAIEAVNKGEIYRLLVKPWSRAELLATVKQAHEFGELQRERARLTELVRLKNEELEQVNRNLERLVQERTTNLLEGMVAALDYRDTETQWHSRRVSLYARRLGQELGLDDRALFTVEVGALLHDIGKIGVRDSVLLKPGPLTASEWVEMRRHPALGYRLLRRIEYLREPARIVLEHQERWDGAGYPAGLKGEESVIGARIFAVVDTLDAILSDRSYRKGQPFEVAAEEIRRCSGTQFDPACVEAFVAVPRSDWDAIRARVEVLAAEERRRDEADGLSDGMAGLAGSS